MERDSLMDVYIWGLSKKSGLFRNILEHMSHVRFLGYLSDRPQCFGSIGGVPVKLLDESVIANCDAIIAADGNWRSRKLSDVIRKKVIDSSLFTVLRFSMEKYLEIVQAKWCIVIEIKSDFITGKPDWMVLYACTDGTTWKFVTGTIGISKDMCKTL